MFEGPVDRDGFGCGGVDSQSDRCVFGKGRKGGKGRKKEGRGRKGENFMKLWVVRDENMTLLDSMHVYTDEELAKRAAAIVGTMAIPVEADPFATELRRGLRPYLVRAMYSGVKCWPSGSLMGGRMLRELGDSGKSCWVWARDAEDALGKGAAFIGGDVIRAVCRGVKGG